jgi:hypothetical protein
LRNKPFAKLNRLASPPKTLHEQLLSLEEISWSGRKPAGGQVMPSVPENSVSRMVLENR